VDLQNLMSPKPRSFHQSCINVQGKICSNLEGATLFFTSKDKLNCLTGSSYAPNEKEFQVEKTKALPNGMGHALGHSILFSRFNLVLTITPRFSRVCHYVGAQHINTYSLPKIHFLNLKYRISKRNPPIYHYKCGSKNQNLIWYIIKFTL